MINIITQHWYAFHIKIADKVSEFQRETVKSMKRNIERFGPQDQICVHEQRQNSREFRNNVLSTATVCEYQDSRWTVYVAHIHLISSNELPNDVPLECKDFTTRVEFFLGIRRYFSGIVA